MIIVSTCREMGDHPENDRNQLAAKRSWEFVADTIVYFNKPQPELASSKTVFIDSEHYPRLIDVVDFCADQTQWCAIVNADIVLTPVLKPLEKQLIEKHAAAATSWRWQFDPNVGIDPCAHIDCGLDFFAGTPATWDKVFNGMGQTPQGWHDSPSHLRLAAPTWDQWLLGALNKVSRHHFYNLTKYKVVLHPAHGNRKHGQGIPDVHHIGACAMAEREL